jgi:hypothetical protein
VFELVGPGSPHPTLSDVTAGAAVGGTGLGIGVPDSQAPGDAVGTFPVVAPVDGTATVTWTWSRPEAVEQVSVGAAAALSGVTGGVEVDLRGTDGRWRAVAGAPGGVGDAGTTPYLLAQLSRPVPATALRVSVRAGGPVAVVDAHALAAPA